jgi:hypothetical protein
VNDGLERKWSWNILSFLPGGTKETTKNFSQNNRSPRKEPNPCRVECEGLPSTVSVFLIA